MCHILIVHCGLQMKHPNIVAFADAFLENDFVCIVTEFCEGGDLASYITRVKEENAVVPQQQIMDWLIQLTMALQYMHER